MDDWIFSWDYVYDRRPDVETRLDSFAETLVAYRRGSWEEARAGFERCLAIIPCDAPSKVFLGRLALLRSAESSADWTGVWSMTEK